MHQELPHGISPRCGSTAPFVLIAALATVAATYAQEAGFEHEKIGDPPAAKAAIDNPAARSPGMRVVTGPYVSVQVNVDPLGRNIVGDAANECSIAVNPLNPNNMVIGWRQFNSISSTWREPGWAYTFDKGATWRYPGSIIPDFGSDPVLDVDSLGNFYYQSLWVNFEDPGPFTTRVYKSTDGGVSWQPWVYSGGGDKNWIAIDRTGGPGDGFVYGIWQRFSVACCDMNVLTRSVDAGASFQPPVPVAMWPWFGTLTVGVDGTVYAGGGDGTIEHDRTQIVVSRTTNVPNAGVPPTTEGTGVGLGGTIATAAGPNPSGILGQINVAADHSNGPTRGNVYVLASLMQSTSTTDVRFSRSTDGGRSFSGGVRVNDDPVPPDGLFAPVPPPPQPNWHWMAAMAVASNGRIDAIWYDTRESGVVNLSRLYYAYSWDAGATWSPNVAVSPEFDSWLGGPGGDQRIGDYITLVSDATGADAAYAATFNQEQDIYYVRLFPDCNGNGRSDVSDLASHTSFDCNLDHIPDECQASPACIGAGAIAEAGSAGTLKVDKGVGDAITLSWGPSCVSGDADYAVYEGTLGSFDSRSPRTCSTGGAANFDLTPGYEGAYYLVVPVHADREGSYGTMSPGLERAPAPGACVPQSLKACS